MGIEHASFFYLGEERNPKKMAITKQARSRNVVDERPADLNEDQANRFKGGGSDDLDLTQAVRVLMEKQRITKETQRQM